MKGLETYLFAKTTSRIFTVILSRVMIVTFFFLKKTNKIEIDNHHHALLLLKLYIEKK